MSLLLYQIRAAPKAVLYKLLVNPLKFLLAGFSNPLNSYWETFTVSTFPTMNTLLNR